jgi:drug/metabolite transporter (DMT)-like permease
MSSISWSATSAAQIPTERGPWLGVAHGAGAGALWGLVFLAPQVAGTFSPLQLTIGRYFCYGAIAAALLAPRWRSLVASLSWQQWLRLSGLAFAGNTLYYVLLSTAVQTGGIAMTSLVIGFLPVAVTIVGSRDRGAVPLGRLFPSLALCVAGSLCIGWQALAGPTVGSAASRMVGLFCAVGAMMSWTIYAVCNARSLSRLQQVSAHEWNLLTGIVTGAQSLALIPLALLLETKQHGPAEWGRYVIVSTGVAVLASIAGDSLWNRMSRLLPLTLVGQMILFETLFALWYGFLWDHRLPALLEIGAVTCVILSVLSCLAAHRRR